MRYKPLTISKKQAQSWQPTSGDLRPETTCCAKNPKCGMTGMQAVFVSIAMSSNRVQHLVPFVADVQSLRYLCGWFFTPIDKRILKTAWWSRNSQFPFLFTVHPSHCIFFSPFNMFSSGNHDQSSNWGVPSFQTLLGVQGHSNTRTRGNCKRKASPVWARGWWTCEKLGCWWKLLTKNGQLPGKKCYDGLGSQQKSQKWAIPYKPHKSL